MDKWKFRLNLPTSVFIVTDDKGACVILFVSLEQGFCEQ